MDGREKTRQQLIDELATVRRELAALKAAKTKFQHAEETWRKLEAELRENKTVLQATIDNLPFDFFSLGPDGRYRFQNVASREHWHDVTGSRPEDVPGAEQNLALWQENNRRAFAGQHVEEEVELWVQGEKRFYFNVITPIIENGQIQGILGVNIDITERKQAEQALRQSEQRYRTLAE